MEYLVDKVEETEFELREFLEEDTDCYPLIFGDYVYKTLICNDPSPGIDVISSLRYSYTRRLGKALSLDSITVDDTERGIGVSRISISDVDTNTDSVHINIIDINTYLRLLQRGLTFTTSLVKTNKGIKHIMEVPEIGRELNLDIKNPKEDREWIINSLKARKYCPWSDMIDEDKEYFSKFTKISREECKLHGMEVL